jgi:hypothetical protein
MDWKNSMSLLKAYHIQLDPARTLELIKADFTAVIAAVMEGTKNGTKFWKEELLAHLIMHYTEYSVTYLNHVAVKLEEPTEATASMKFMNSYIVSLLHEAKLHYYDKEQGFSVIDKSVQKALDNQGYLSVNDVTEIFGIIEASYIEEEFEEDLASESDDEK